MTYGFNTGFMFKSFIFLIGSKVIDTSGRSDQVFRHVKEGAWAKVGPQRFSSNFCVAFSRLDILSRAEPVAASLGTKEPL